MNAHEAIHNAEWLLPGAAATEGEVDLRWQAIIAIGEFIESEPEPVLAFAERWGQHPDDDLRQAIATCLLEHLLERHFDMVLPRAERLARASDLFARTLGMCWPFGQAEHSNNAARFKRLLEDLGA
ncbi:MAG: hypothetical protein LLG00_10675 [Planctomycetaceae bacterium]|nr:hypothetical protein [Planctomycetaceae bacterium]